MSNNKVKVVGYAQRVFYNDGIEYRNFNPDLVGVQLASDGGTPLFTMGNFSITTNIEPKSDKTFVTNKFSNFVSLSDIDLTLQETQTLLTDNAGVMLNLDKTNLNYYALFGSLSEFIRVSLEDIIIKWPASLNTSPISQTDSGELLTGYTFENYSYDILSEVSSFRVSTSSLVNKFQIDYLTNANIVNSLNTTNDFSAPNELRNLTVNYAAYAILFNGVEFPVIGFTGATNSTNDYIYFTVQGNAFSGQPVNSYVTYHIKPNETYEEQFFNALPDFEGYLLNRLVTPEYTATFKYPIKTDAGVILYVTDSITWPVSDGYNIDFDTTEYVRYVSKLLEIATDSDLYSSDLMNRFLVTESISAFDTMPVYLSDLDKDTSGQKVNKTLRIYGAEFDEINDFIVGINFANTVTYNKQDNTPDIYLKNLARVFGWGLISSVLENNLLTNYVTTEPSSYSGYTVGLTAVEADVELWRRLILNTPWLWKSKGARKSIEFLLRFIGAPLGLIQFNEYIYKAEAPIDLDLFKQILTLNGLSTDLSTYPIDGDGYPSPLADTTNLYFQNDGLWYRETGGSGSTIDILTGNNPHLGPYDGGYKYINQFRGLIPNFSAVTLTSQTITTGATNLFVNYNLGDISKYSGVTYVDSTFDNGTSLSGCVVVTSTIITDPMPNTTINDCGCTSAADDDSLSICVDIDETNPSLSTCSNALAIIPTVNPTTGLYSFSYLQYDINGNIITNNGNPVYNQTNYSTKQCCKAIGGIPTLYGQYTNNILTNNGYVCCDKSGKCGCTVACKWMVSSTPIIITDPLIRYITPPQYLNFIKQDGSNVVVNPDGCNCVAGLTIPVPNILDPFTGDVGYGCQLTQQGIADLALGTAGVLYQTYHSRSIGTIGCSVVPLVNSA